MRAAVLLAVVTISCAAPPVSEPDAGETPDAARPPETCLTNDGTLFAYGDEAASTRELADLTGDGEADPVRLLRMGDSDFKLRLGARDVTGVDFLLTVVSADMNRDGHNDLWIGEPWKRRLSLLLGPFDSDRALEDADAVLTGPGDGGGLSTLFSIAFLVHDLDADGDLDVLATSPAEREEGCLGTAAPLLFSGPFAPGDRRGPDEASVTLEGPRAGSCLGEGISCETGGVRLSARPDDACWSIPVAAAPTGCSP